MSLLLGNASAAYPNVRTTELFALPSSGFPSPMFNTGKHSEPYEDGALWSGSRLSGDACAALQSGPRFEKWPPLEIGGSASRHRIVGTTRDSDDNPLGNVTMDLFLTDPYLPAGLVGTDSFVGTMTSGTQGYYQFWTPYAGQNHYIRAYLPGSPDRAGTSVNTIVPVSP